MGGDDVVVVPAETYGRLVGGVEEAAATWSTVGAAACDGSAVVAVVVAGVALFMMMMKTITRAERSRRGFAETRGSSQGMKECKRQQLMDVNKQAKEESIN